MHGDLQILINRMEFKYISVALICCALLSCKNNSEKNPAAFRPGNKEMADLNRYLLRKDRERIQNYIERKNLRMTETPTGLWFQILKEGAGDAFKDNDIVMVDYECSLLDGTKCYSSEELGPREIIVGRSEIEAGLNEGIRMLNHGSEAIFIIPPFLAYGLLGDRNLIPPRAVLVYTVSARAK